MEETAGRRSGIASGLMYGLISGNGFFPGVSKMPRFPAFGRRRFEDFTTPSMHSRQRTGLAGRA